MSLPKNSRSLVRVGVLALLVASLAESSLGRSKSELLEERARIGESMEIVAYKRVRDVTLVRRAANGRRVPDKTVEYVDLRLSILRPPGFDTKDRRPAILFFHGGGFQSGSATQFFVQAELFAKRGAVAFCVEYRLKEKVQVTIAEQLEDARTAVRWVRANSEALGVDPRQVVAAGGSAGGYLAMAAGTLEMTEKHASSQSLSSVPDAMVLYNPAIDFDVYLKQRGRKRLVESIGGPIEKYSGTPNLRPGLPPAIIFQGTSDEKTPFERAEAFARKSRAKGNVCELVRFRGVGHGFHNRDPYINRCAEKAVAFLKENGFALR